MDYEEGRVPSSSAYGSIESELKKGQHRDPVKRTGRVSVFGGRAVTEDKVFQCRVPSLDKANGAVHVGVTGFDSNAEFAV